MDRLDAGPDGQRMTATVARRLVAEGVAPMAAAGYLKEGRAPVIGGECAALFDLASLTKPMTALALARAGVPRETPLVELLPEVVGTPSAELPLELFLSHRAGLIDHLPLYGPLRDGGSVDASEALLAAATGRRPDARGSPGPGGFPPIYSDLGFILAGEALARVTSATDAGEAIERLIAEPLGLADELGTSRGLRARGVDLQRRAAPTELVTWRGGVVLGAVHDENAWALTGLGGSGHAGMFGTIGAMLRFAEAALSACSPGPSSRDLLGFPGQGPGWLVRERPGGPLRAGFDGKSTEGSSAGSRLGARSFGHLGFTGTSFWIDPDARIAVAVLTNRVHPTRDNVKIRAARPLAHDALARAALAGG